MEREQVELLPELAVVPALRLLEPLEMLGELLVREEGGPVDRCSIRLFSLPSQ
jgi:hypothetical protein